MFKLILDFLNSYSNIKSFIDHYLEITAFSFSLNLLIISKSNIKSFECSYSSAGLHIWEMELLRITATAYDFSDLWLLCLLRSWHGTIVSPSLDIIYYYYSYNNLASLFGLYLGVWNWNIGTGLEKFDCSYI